jgi:hypothetical protein
MLTGSKYTLKVNVDWVYLNASVRERHSNRSIAHLNKKDFLVYEDRLSQQVEYFEPMETPFNLILLLVHPTDQTQRSNCHSLLQLPNATAAEFYQRST